MEEEDSSRWQNGRERCEVKSYAMLLDGEDAQRTRAWRQWHVSEEAREAEQQHWKASVWKRLRMEQKVKEMVSGENKHQGTMFSVSVFLCSCEGWSKGKLGV